MGGGSGSLALGSFLPVLMPNGFLATGGVSQVDGLGFLVIGDTVDRQCIGRKMGMRGLFLSLGLQPAGLLNSL